MKFWYRSMDFRLFNTLTRRKELLRPIVPGRVGIYTCGPTVYAPAHIGNLRSYIFPDLLKKTLRRLGYQVRQVINITDVGHLTSDADTGEDKLEQAARQAHRSAWDVAAEYTSLFLADLGLLKVDVPPDLPRATAHIAEQIALIARLEAKGFTYATDDGVYFDTSLFPDYGRMARLKVEGLQEGSRVEMGGKRNKTDFALWKFSPPDARRQMEWESPWGKGFPGWHIECSAMSIKYLGERFDIHTGGSDHIPVHHTNEIAQSEAANGHPFVNVWLHGEYLVLGGSRRMGKSEGNLMRLDSLIEQGFDPLSFRYLALNSHYRSYLNFSTEALGAAETSLLGLRKLVRDAGGADKGAAEDGAPGRAADQSAAAAAAPAPPEGPSAALLADLSDDLNAPKALATLWTALRDPALADGEKVKLARFCEDLLSLDLFDFSRVRDDVELAELDQVPPAVRELAERRWAARQAKDWALADQLRDQLAQAGYAVRDGAGSYQLTRGGE